MVIELTHEDQARLAQLAKATDISEQVIAREALHWFLARPESHTERIEASRKQVAAGITISHEDLFAEIDRFLSAS
jgi:predicted transcriptional regulator